MSNVATPIAGHHPAWLPPEVWEPIGKRAVTFAYPDNNDGVPWSQMDTEVLGTIQRLVSQAADRQTAKLTTPEQVAAQPQGMDQQQQIHFTIQPDHGADPEAFTIKFSNGDVSVNAATPRGLLYGLFELVRKGDWGANHPDASKY